MASEHVHEVPLQRRGDGQADAAAPDSPILLQADRMHARIGLGSTLDAISVQVRRGEVLAVLGPNGAGKTSLLRSFLGLLRPDSGSVHLLGQKVTRRPVPVLHQVGSFLGTPAFYETMTVGNHCQLVARLRCHEAPVSLRSLRELSARFDLKNHWNKRVANCSSGVRKRLAITCALIGSSELVLLDDPTAELDNAAATEFKHVLEDIRRERRTAAVLVTHSFSLARESCDRVLMVVEGRHVFYGTWSQYDSSVGGLYRLDCLGPKDLTLVQFPPTLGIHNLRRTRDHTYVCGVRHSQVSDLVEFLVHEGFKIRLVGPTPAFSEEHMERLKSLGSAQTIPEDADGPSSNAALPAEMANGERHGAGPSTWRRIRTIVGWEIKDACRRATWWMVPVVLAAFCFLGIGLAVPLNRHVFDQEISMAYLAAASSSLLLMVASVVTAVYAAVSICRDYSQSRLRFLLTLPLTHGHILIARLFVGSVLVPTYALACVFPIALGCSLVVGRILGYPWALPDLHMPIDMFIRELLGVVPGLLISYIGIAVLATTLGTVFHKTVPTVTMSVLSVVIGFISLPTIGQHVMPHTSIITQANSRLIALGNGIVTLPSSLVSSELLQTLAIGAVCTAVAWFSFRRKLW